MTIRHIIRALLAIAIIDQSLTPPPVFAQAVAVAAAGDDAVVPLAMPLPIGESVSGDVVGADWAAALADRRSAVSAGLAGRSSEIDCLAQAIAYEAGNQPEIGQQAVAQVIINRVRHRAFPKSVCAVVFQGSERKTGCQFTFACDGSLHRALAPRTWERALRIAAAAVDGALPPTVGAATHYHANYVSPRWAPAMVRIASIGAHIFYRFPGVTSLMTVEAARTLGLASALPDAEPGAALAPPRRHVGTAAAPEAFRVWGLTPAALVASSSPTSNTGDPALPGRN